MLEQPTDLPRSRVAEAVRRALLLVGPAESSYDERPVEDEAEVEAATA